MVVKNGVTCTDVSAEVDPDNTLLMIGSEGNVEVDNVALVVEDLLAKASSRIVTVVEMSKCP